MRLIIVRHAYAGQKRLWVGPDTEWPLDALGEQQARSLVPLIVRSTVTRIVSSPALRCVQTVTPLSQRLQTPVELRPDLGPDGFSRRILAACLGDTTFDDAVLCTHGEHLQPLLQRSDIRRLARDAGLRRDDLLTKGSAWRLHVEPDGRVTRLTHLAPRVP